MMSFFKKIDWLTSSFFSLTLLLSIAGLAVYIPLEGVHWLEPVYCASAVFIIALVIAGGYHRYFSHKAYESHPILKVFYLIVGAAGFQQSALIWASDHRNHHKYVDTEKDPYNIKQGFWWAHIGWILTKGHPKRQDLSNVADLMKDRWVMWQHRYWMPLGVILSFGIPLLIGFLIGRPIGMFLWGAVLRIVITHHTTSTINSIAHKFGTQPYTDQNSARDVWWLAPFLCGESYHNYHHCFQWDYRNGIRWYHWDPTKWALWLLSKTFLVRNLRRTPTHLIVKARLEMDLKHLERRWSAVPSKVWTSVYECVLRMRRAFEETAECYTNAKKSYRELKKMAQRKPAMVALPQTSQDSSTSFPLENIQNPTHHFSHESLSQLKRTLQEKKDAFKKQFSEWNKMVRSLYRQATLSRNL